MCFIVFFVFSHRPVPSHNQDSRGSNKFCHHKHQKHPTNGAKAPPRWCRCFRLHPPSVQGTLHGGVLTPQVASQHRSSGPENHQYYYQYFFKIQLASIKRAMSCKWFQFWQTIIGGRLVPSQTERHGGMTPNTQCSGTNWLRNFLRSVWEWDEFGAKRGQDVFPTSKLRELPGFPFWVIPKHREITICHMLKHLVTSSSGAGIPLWAKIGAIHDWAGIWSFDIIAVTSYIQNKHVREHVENVFKRRNMWVF